MMEANLKIKVLRRAVIVTLNDRMCYAKKNGQIPGRLPPNEDLIPARPSNRAAIAERRKKNTDIQTASLTYGLSERPYVPWSSKHQPGNKTTPVLTDERERRKSILSNQPARFQIKDDPDFKAGYPIYHVTRWGVTEVRRYSKLVDEVAREEGVDPDLAKAIMFIENAHGGHYGTFGEIVNWSDSIQPMNIRKGLWKGLVGPNADFDDPRTNITAGIRLIKRIGERVENPTVGKIAALYNNLKLTDITHSERPYAAWVMQAYRDRLWEKTGSWFPEEKAGPRSSFDDPNYSP